AAANAAAANANAAAAHRAAAATVLAVSRAAPGNAPAPAPAAARPAPAPPAGQPAPPVGAGGGAAVAAALSRLGDPYVWGASGPGSFDCSGLVMWAWARAGVSLSHFSGAQYASTQHISMSQLQPGDLVF